MNDNGDRIGKTNEEIYRAAWLAAMEAIGHRENCPVCKRGDGCPEMFRIREPIYEAAELDKVRIEAGAIDPFNGEVIQVTSALPPPPLRRDPHEPPPYPAGALEWS